MKKLKSILQSNLSFIIILFVSIFLTIIRLNFIKDKSYYNESFNSVYGYVIDYKYSNNKITIILKAKEKLIINYYGDDNPNISYGDYILVKGEFIKPKDNTNFNLFNYRKYLLSQNINYTVTASNIEKVKGNKNIFYHSKTKILKQINKSKKSSNYIKAFVFADKSYINKEVIDAYQTLGISHLFAVSGMHVSLTTILLLRLLKNLKEENKYIIISLILIFYLFLTNYTISMFRACSQFILFFINKHFKLNMKNANIVLGLLCILLLYNPYYLYNPGFIFSFSISFSLIYFSKMLNNSNFFVSLLKITLLSFFVSLPVVINNFNQINFLSIIYNLIFVPFVSYIVFPFSIISLIFPFFDNFNYIIISIFENICLFLSNINLLKFDVANIPVIFIMIYYLVLILLIYRRKLKYIIFMVLLMVFFINYKSFIITPKITFFDVSQGDSALIRIFNKNILIDTGGFFNYGKNTSYSIASDILINYFKKDGVKKIDYMILTHGDYDHMGEASNLIQEFTVEKVIFNCNEYNDLEKELIKNLEKKKITYYNCVNELNTNNKKLYFLNTGEYDNENDDSNVIYTELNNYKFLFMGDSGKIREEDILDKYCIKDIDVLKVGHHGSKTSSGKKFINETNPKYSIISVGKNNRYGHPNKEVLNNLDKSKIYRTDINGSINFKLNRSKLKIKTCIP